MHALLLAKAASCLGTELLGENDQIAILKGAGFTAATADLMHQLDLPALLASVAARLDAGEAAVNPPASLPHEILDSAAPEASYKI